MLNLIKKYKEIIMYLIFGVLTTLVNVLVYYICYNVSGINNTISTIIAWIISVIFAYITNKIFVFSSKTNGFKGFVIEFIVFILCRLFSGLVDLGFMTLTVTYLKLNTKLLSTIMKIISNVIVVIINYILSKLLVFRKKKDKDNLNNQNNEDLSL